MQKTELKILGISSGHTSTSYTLILEEKNGSRKLPIIIGAFEAQAIAIEIEKIVPVRPMTHDLFKSLSESFDIKVKEVIIHRLHEGIFYAHVVCANGTREHEIDARTSDAIAIALRFKCPIFTYESILQDAGIILSDLEAEELEKDEKRSRKSPSAKTSAEKPADLAKQSMDDLKKLLDEAIEVENYILAAKLRDEIRRREEGKEGDNG
ncbi:MAG: bifunctional nuclease domain-containing protein [Bacteroidia bacterium]